MSTPDDMDDLADLWPPDDFEKTLDNPRFIAGIHNYCDRWCERCPFTARCSVYAVEQQSAARKPEGQDITNAAFWEHLHSTFAKTKQMIIAMAAQRGIDLSKIEDDPQAARRARLRHERISETAPVKQARAYADSVEQWLHGNVPMFASKQEELELWARLAVAHVDPEADARDIRDAIEIIRWYQHFIHIKLSRARAGQEDERGLDPDEAYPKDSDGSAKIALIAIDRSIAAWARLREHFPDKADAMLDILVALDRLRRQVEADFPDARAFRRPGFDD